MVSARMAVRLIGTISTLFLARLLTPADFGLVAVAMSVVGLCQASTEFGFDLALIRDSNACEADYATAWTADLLRGALLAALLLLLAHPLSAFLNDARLSALLSALSVIPVLEGLYNPRFVDFDKRMQFRPFFILMVAVKVTGFMVTVGLAIAWRSYWALIAGSIISNVARLLLSYVLIPYRPRFTLSSWRKLMGFSGWLAGAQLLGAMGTRLDNVILKKLLTAHGVGIFSVSRDLTSMAFQEITLPLRRVLFPALSRLTSASDAFRHAYFVGVSALFMILAPIGLGLALVARDAVPILLGGQWQEAVYPIQWFSLMAGFWAITAMAQSAAMSANQTRMIFRRNLVYFPIRITIFILGAEYYGLLGAVVSSLIADIFLGILNLTMMNRILGTTILQHVRAFERSLGALLAMTLCVVTVQWLIPAGTGLITHGFRLAAATGVGVLVYPAVHLLLWRASGRPIGAEQRIIDLLARWRSNKFTSAQ